LFYKHTSHAAAKKKPQDERQKSFVFVITKSFTLKQKMKSI